MELVLNSLGHVSSPAVSQPVGIDLILDGGVQSRRGVEHIDAVVQVLEVLKGIFHMVAGIDELINGETQGDDHSGAYSLADFIDDHTTETCTVLSGAAELVSTIVHGRRKELADQIGVTCVDLDYVEACDLCSLCSFTIILGNALKLFSGKGTGNLSARLGRKSGGGDGLHSDSGTHSGCAGVVDLNADHAAVFMNCLCQIQQTGNITVLINSELCCTIGSFRILDTNVFYENQAGTAACTLHIILDVLISQLTGMSGEVAAHGHHNNTVRQCQSIDCNGAEQIFEVILHFQHLR